AGMPSSTGTAPRSGRAASARSSTSRRTCARWSPARSAGSASRDSTISRPATRWRPSASSARRSRARGPSFDHDQLPDHAGRCAGQAGDHADHPARAERPADRVRQHHRGPHVARPALRSSAGERARRRDGAEAGAGRPPVGPRPDPARARQAAPEPKVLSGDPLRARSLDRVLGAHLQDAAGDPAAAGGGARGPRGGPRTIVTETVRAEYAKVRELVEANDQVLIFGHKDADGDTLGCSLAVAEALRSQGKEVWVLIPPPVPDMYSWLPGFDMIVESPSPGADPGLVLFFDAGNMERSGDAVKHIAGHARIVNIDHHASNSLFGDINVIDTAASAVGQMVLEMFEEFGWPVTPTIATNLYTAVLTDTGGFRHENTTPKVLEDAARLARYGADPGQVASMVYKSRPLTTLKLSALSIAT